jgi:fructosamine-3-kinase
MVPHAIEEKILVFLKENISPSISFTGSYSLQGGCINEAVCFQTNYKKYFLKWNSVNRYPEMFASEAKGLTRLNETGIITVPQVIFQNNTWDHSFLLLEFIEPVERVKNFWDDFGIALACLHRVSDSHFGLDNSNYIGSLVQKNNKHDNWIDFFITERLDFQLQLALKNDNVPKKIANKFERLYNKLHEIFPIEPPALLHGDLWNGNFMVDSKGKACIFDPAIYFGHREMDLAMSLLFGGFSLVFYESYNSVYPLEKGWKQRMDICNLYPLLVHVNLFGGSYLSSIETILDKY